MGDGVTVTLSVGLTKIIVLGSISRHNGLNALSPHFLIESSYHWRCLKGLDCIFFGSLARRCSTNDCGVVECLMLRCV